MKQPLLVFTFLLPGILVSAQQTERIETDRPDQTESPFIVPLRYLQSEIGFNAMNYKGGIRQWVHPTVLAKYGLNQRLELRLELSPYTEMAQQASGKKGQMKLEPVEVGTKVRLFEEKGLRPKTSVIAHVGLPFLASKDYRTATMIYTTRLTLQNTLSETVALGYNLGVERDLEGASAFFYTFAPGFNIGNRWYAYIEAFGAHTYEWEHNIDGGIAYHPSTETKIDLSGGFGLGDSPLKNYVALGFSFRLPLR
ncbi:transporter [Flavisolibacter nicotianae]|uniref:transporter n=1 Tax=Flavisolibacter nicotianae TaxID=2364882 RepID=UPI000EB58C0D|nr:transporter [Flavisolibacter nicotianae]